MPAIMRIASHVTGLLIAFSAFSLPTTSTAAPKDEPILQWRSDAGVVWRTPAAEVRLDRSAAREGPTLRFLPSGAELPLTTPMVQQEESSRLRLVYEVSRPDQLRLTVTRTLREQRTAVGNEIVEDFELNPSAPIGQDLEIVRPFTFRTSDVAPATAVLPLKNGWAKPVKLDPAGSAAEYRLGHWISGNETPELALPVVEVDCSNAWQAAVCADPRFSALFRLQLHDSEITGEVRFRYASSRVPLSGPESRRFGFWLHPSRPEEKFGGSIDAFFRLMLSDVPAGPDWLHGIYMVGYDFLSDDGLGWERDVRLLASWLEPAERSHVALCLHGWYDALGAYSFDDSAGQLKSEWVAMGRTRKVPFTPEELRRRLRLAREQGFRVLLYFADGLAADSGVPGYHDDWAWRDDKGNKVPGWQGPDTFGPTFMMNPSHPKVQERFQRYLGALLHSVGSDVDGFVWDETFHARGGQIASQPVPAYCDRSMFDLVKALTDRVHRFDPEKVFLASDCIGIAPNIPSYAMVADGLYQDTHCDPARWPDALFPNWRNTYWSCNWGPHSHFGWTRYGVEQFGAPVAISNGWEEDHGPSEWSWSERDSVLNLFRMRLARGPVHVRYLTEDPAKLLTEKAPVK